MHPSENNERQEETDSDRVWGPDGRVIWGAGLSACDLQVAGSIPVAARSCDPPHHRGFGDRDTNTCMAVTMTLQYTVDMGGNWPRSRPALKIPIIIIIISGRV